MGKLIEEQLYVIGNIDATIIAQKPKMAPHIEQMRINVAKTLNLDISQVNIKATTEEGLGFTGAGEGISAQAICLLTSPRELYSRQVYDEEEECNCSRCPGCKG